MSGITFADGSVRIRASVSLNSPSDPLVVVDGIPMDLSVLNTIPVEDVSELKVLKDAGEYGGERRERSDRHKKQANKTK